MVDQGDWIVMTGDPESGFLFHGTFKNREDAQDWAETNDEQQEWGGWYICRLRPVTEGA
jgi:hypothetical protein